MSAVLHHGARSNTIGALKVATNKRLGARDLASFRTDSGDVLTNDALVAIRKAAWALGALKTTYEAVTKKGEVHPGIVAMIMNPGERTDEQKKVGKDRIAFMRSQRKKREKAESSISHGRLLFVENCVAAMKAYELNPGAYHYLAGGNPNLIYKRPSPLSYRSDCSQYASSVQDDSHLPALGPNGALWVNTDVMDHHLELTDSPEPADFGMYGVHHGGTHHVECYVGSLGIRLHGTEFSGHGSPPIDGLTPGRPNFYLRNPIAA